MRVKQPLGIERDEFSDQRPERRARHRLDSKDRRASPLRQLMGLERQPGHDAKAAAAPAFQRPEQVGVGAGVGDPHFTVGGHHLGFEQRGRGGTVILREAAKPAALDKPRDADRGAAAALHKTPGIAGHRVVDMQPDRPGADRDRRLRRRAATLRHERIMERNIVHRARPDQQRIGRIRRAVKAVAAAFDDQAQIVLAGEIDGGRDIGGSLGGDRIDARRRRPGVSPAGALRRPGLVADEERIAQIAQKLLAGGRVGIVGAGLQRCFDLDEAPADHLLQPVPLHRGGPVGIAGPHPPRYRAELAVCEGWRRKAGQEKGSRRRQLQDPSPVHCSIIVH